MGARQEDRAARHRCRRCSRRRRRPPLEDFRPRRGRESPSGGDLERAGRVEVDVHVHVHGSGRSSGGEEIAQESRGAGSSRVGRRGLASRPARLARSHPAGPSRPLLRIDAVHRRVQRPSSARMLEGHGRQPPWMSARGRGDRRGEPGRSRGGRDRGLQRAAGRKALGGHRAGRTPCPRERSNQLADLRSRQIMSNGSK